MRRVELEVTVAGREFRQTFEAKPNLKHAFEWDGKDAYGREVEGAQNAEVRIGYVYPAEYLEPAEFEASFGQFGGAPVTRNETGSTEESRREIIAWQEWERPVGVLGAGADALGGWTLDVHHAYDPQARTLYLGNGSKVTTEAIRCEIGTTIGATDGGFDPSRPASSFPLETSRGTDAGADGSTYIAETSADRILKVTKEGQVEIVADEDDGVTAPRDVAVADDGTLYISDTGNARIVKIDPLGNRSTFAGGADPDTLGDGGPATSASLKQPRGIALAADGTLYITETGRNRVRRVAPDGRINTVATDLDLPTDVAVDAEGTLFVADAMHHRVLQVTAQGETTTLAGDGGAGNTGDGGPATAAQVGQPYGVDVAADGTVYFSDRVHHVVRRVSKDGTITTYAGTGRSGEEGDGDAPQQAQLTFPEDVTVAPDQSVQIADTGNARIRRAAPGLPGFVDADFSLPSQDGTAVFMFDRSGRHLRTVDALTGVTRLTFGYDAEGRLTTVTDGDGNVVTIERDATGKATAIVAPGNIRTSLTIRPDGMLGRGQERRERGAHARLPRGRPAEDVQGPARPRRALHLRRDDRPAEDRRGQERLGRHAHARADGHRLPHQAHVGHEQGHAVRGRAAARRRHALDHDRPVRRQVGHGVRRRRRHAGHAARRHREHDDARRRPALGHARAVRGDATTVTTPAGRTKVATTSARSSSSSRPTRSASRRSPTRRRSTAGRRGASTTARRARSRPPRPRTARSRRPTTPRAVPSRTPTAPGVAPRDLPGTPRAA